ncbi:MAG TPA: HIT domain-containing protein [Candidatus Saccharimonadia bacterium]
MQTDCLFCKLSRDGGTVIWHNDDFAAIKDINPKAPLHLLIMPKQHVENFDQLEVGMAPGLVAAIREVARQEGVSGAYNMKINVGRAAGQEIDHLHVHLLANKEGLSVKP